MAKRALREGELVCIRPECVAAVSRSERTRAKAHMPCKLVDRIDNGRRVVLAISTPWEPGVGDDNNVIFVWPSQVRLADGAEEQLWKRERKMIAKIAAMKAKRRRERATKRRRKVAA